MNQVQKRFFAFCLVIGVLVLSAAIIVVRSISGPSGPDPMAKSKNLKAADKGVTMADRLGVDDNSAIAFLYGADMQGSLDVCG